MKNNSQKIQLFLSATLFVFFCVAFIFLYEEINNNNQKAEQGAIDFQTEMNRRAEITSLDKTLQDNDKNSAILATHFAKSSDIVPFLDAIEKLAPQAGAKMEIDSVDNGVATPGLIAGLRVSGSFTNVYKFLQLLENSPYEINFISMDMHTVAAGVPVENVVTPSKGASAQPKVAKSPNWEAVFKIQLLSFTP